MNKSLPATALAGALLASSLLVAPAASAAPAATPTSVVQVQQGHRDGPTYGQRIRGWVCNIAPALCR